MAVIVTVAWSEPAGMVSMPSVYPGVQSRESSGSEVESVTPMGRGRVAVQRRPEARSPRTSSAEPGLSAHGEAGEGHLRRRIPVGCPLYFRR